MFHALQSRRLVSDQLAVRGAVTAIRNSLVQPGERLPSSPMPGARTYGRLNLQASVWLMPVLVGDRRVAILDGSPISARACNVSLEGIGLVHPTPLPGRYAAALFSAVAPICLVVELTRSRLDGEDSWNSGARILGLISSLQA